MSECTAIAIESVNWVDGLAVRSRPAAFTPWSRRLDGEAEESLPVPRHDDAIRADGFAQGFEEGRRTVELELAEERAALAKLAESIALLRPQPPELLAGLLAETVDRLVTDIVGEAGVDADLLVQRAEAAAALVADEAQASRLLVHPDDLLSLVAARIPVEIATDPMLGRGTVLVETGKGWIEDGPAVRLDRLRTQLARLGAAA